MDGPGLGLVTMVATATKIAGTDNKHSVSVSVKSDDTDDIVVWNISNVTNTAGQPLSSTTSDKVVISSTSFTVDPDTSKIFNMNIFYISENNEKGSCTSFAALPAKYQTIYRYQPPSVNSATITYNVTVTYNNYQGTIPGLGVTGSLTVPVNITVTYNHSNNNNLFQRYLHNGILAREAFSIKPYKLMSGAADGSLWVDPLGPITSNPGQAQTKTNYIPPASSSNGGISFTAGYFDTTYVVGQTTGLSIAFNIDKGASECMEIVVNIQGEPVAGPAVSLETHGIAIISNNAGNVVNINNVNCYTSSSDKFYEKGLTMRIPINVDYFSPYVTNSWADYLPPGTYFVNVFPAGGVWYSHTQTPTSKTLRVTTVNYITFADYAAKINSMPYPAVQSTVVVGPM